MSESSKVKGSGSGGPSHSQNSTKPVPMKLFSSWEVDRTPSNCIPRLCSLTLSRLVVIRPLPTTEASSILIAVKMAAGSRRTLRSNEIPISDNGLISTDLELHFSLQYPHFLKREENRLLIMLQRRKKYKNRTILGFKTLAEGRIDMAMVLQKSCLDLELGLFPPDIQNKENSGPLARVTINGISSQPVDELVEGERKGGKASSGQLRRLPSLSSPLNPTASSSETTKVPSTHHHHHHHHGHATHHHEFSDEDDDDNSSHSSDSPQDEVIIRKNSKSHPHNRNLKQKIVNLLKKFKQTEEGHRGSEAKPGGGPVASIDQLFDELEGLSDSEPDADTLSVGSFPKPVLPPFFASSKSLVQYNAIPEKSIITSDERGDSDSWTEPDPDQQSGESPKLQLKSPGAYSSSANASSSSPAVHSPPIVNQSSSSMSNNPSKLNLGPVSDQLVKIFPPDDGFPELVVFVSLENGGPGPGLVSALTKCNVKVLGIESDGGFDNGLKVALPHIVGKVQKFCNNNARPPPPLNIVVVGTDSFLSAVTKHYVTQLSSRPQDWQNYFSFIYAPFTTGGSIWRLLCQSDPQYVQNFNDFTDRGNAEELALRIIAFFNLARDKRQIIHLPIAEAMITYKENDESSQVFAPFISEVQLGMPTTTITGGDLLHPADSSSPGGGGGEQQSSHLSSSPPSPPQSPREDPPLELQVDFWKGTVKSSVKAHFRSLSIQRTQENSLAISYVLKEQKKQKIMRLGKKKERESDLKNLTMDGISRLVCLSKSQTPMKLFVDGAEWPGVKFFQVSAQWQSQVKNLPLLVSSQSKGDSV